MAYIFQYLNSSTGEYGYTSEVIDESAAIAELSGASITYDATYGLVGNRVLPDRVSEIGIYDYNDNATATTPINYTATGTYVTITNDGAGAYTNTSNGVDGIDDIYDTSTNQFQWDGLNIGDTVEVRLDVEVTTTIANQEVDIDMELAIGGYNYDIVFMGYDTLAKAGTHHIVKRNGVYMGDSNTLDNGARFKFKSDANATIKVNGWYCKVTKNF